MRFWAGLIFVLSTGGVVASLIAAVVRRSWAPVGYALALIMLAYVSFFFLTVGV